LNRARQGLQYFQRARGRCFIQVCCERRRSKGSSALSFSAQHHRLRHRNIGQMAKASCTRRAACAAVLIAARQRETLFGIMPTHEWAPLAPTVGVALPPVNVRCVECGRPTHDSRYLINKEFFFTLDFPLLFLISFSGLRFLTVTGVPGPGASLTGKGLLGT
jgi:hypothetical protein